MTQTSDQNQSMISPTKLLHEILWLSMRKARIIQVAVQFDIAELLKDGPKSVAELARLSETNADALYRLLRGCAAFGVFEETSPGIFALNDVAECLLAEHPSLMRELALQSGSQWEWASWGALGYSVQTGQPAFDHVHLTDFWSYMDSHPQDARAFNRTMKALALALDFITPILEAYDFSSYDVVADIGGGQGTLLAAILKAHPHPRGLLFDQPPVVEAARSYFLQEHLSERAAFQAGDFFEQVPQGADIYLLKAVLHDWGADAGIRILKTVHQAMSPQTRLLVIERVVRPQRPLSDLTLTDIEMLVNTQGGRERTEADFQTLLDAANFTLDRVIPTDSIYCILECSLREA